VLSTEVDTNNNAEPSRQSAFGEGAAVEPPPSRPNAIHRRIRRRSVADRIDEVSLGELLGDTRSPIVLFQSGHGCPVSSRCHLHRKWNARQRSSPECSRAARV
jgi:hypothetical protein